MKKAFKITGILLASLAALLLILFLVARFIFREQAVAYLTEIEQQHRLELLRTATPYTADTTAVFGFKYTQDTARARQIREYFRLDTLLLPEASTWDNTLTLARFVARNIPHANQTIHPEKRNAVALWEYAQNVEPAFNCRLHAIMLQELLLASGIVNRFVTCLPADSLDRDCHVVNIVWLPERQKWAMIDSDQQAWITDPSGTPLSLAEMRERYIDGLPMNIHSLLGPDRNFRYYRSYWVKNLYWFECWEETGYDQEPNRGRNRSVVLLPPEFEGFRKEESALTTSDAARYWAAPETDTM